MAKSNSQRDQRYDAIVIGSGIGGMAAASLLSQVGGKRVLVLERHFKLGGFSHRFRRGRYEWDPGIHYVGEMYEGALARRMMDLVTQRGVQWQRLGEVVERVLLPGVKFEVSSNPETYQRSLIARFPDEAVNIKRYFADVKRARGWIARWYASKTMPRALAELIQIPGRSLASMSTAEYMKRFQSAELRTILTAQWPDYGTIPAESAFAFHAAVAADYLHGSYYPIGGGSRLSEQMARVVEKQGGACLVSCEVKEIMIEGKRAVGVTAVRKGEERTYWSDTIVSNAGVRTTFGKLLPDGVAWVEKQKAGMLKSGTSALILFLGLGKDPRESGFDDANYWLSTTLEQDSMGLTMENGRATISGAFVTFGSLRNPEQQQPTAQIITFTNDEMWKRFAAKPWKQRGEEYEEKKRSIGTAMLEFAECHLPGLRTIVDYSELATPLSIESFTGHAGGQIYGQACDVDRLFKHSWKCKTSVKGLFMTGSDVGTPGVNGALMAGVMTAGTVLGVTGLPRIFGFSGKRGRK